MVRFVGIDPSSRTGFVALDEQGNVLRAKELTGVGAEDPKRMVTLIDEIMAHLKPDDVVCIESPAMHAKGSAVGFMWGLAHGLRIALYRKGWPYTDVAPTQLKKFACGKGNASKDDLILPVYRKWGFEHSSENVRDAFVLAKIAEELHIAKDFGESTLTCQYEAEVIEAILNPPAKKRKRARA